MLEEILTAWRTNNRVNLVLIDRISDEGMRCTLSKRGGRTVVRQFTHLHNNRIWHLEKRARSVAKGAHVFATKDEPDRETLKAALEDSAARIEQLIVGVHEGRQGVRAFKRGLVPYMAYFVAHESHHRGSILLTLKQSGHPVDRTTAYAIWDWDRI